MRYIGLLFLLAGCCGIPPHVSERYIKVGDVVYLKPLREYGAVVAIVCPQGVCHTWVSYRDISGHLIESEFQPYELSLGTKP